MFPLYLNMLDSQMRPLVLEHLIRDIMETNQCHLTTGNLCSRYVVETLFLYGYADEAYELLTQTTYPSWGYMFENEATTMWERWEMVESYEGYSKMASFNHAMTGSVGVCFHKYLAGIRFDEKHPGFKNAIIRPVIPKKIKHIKGLIETIHGTLSCEWEFANRDKLNIIIQIPFNCTADVYLPIGWCKKNSFKINGSLSKGEMLKPILLEEGDFVYKKISSGMHKFEIAIE